MLFLDISELSEILPITLFILFRKVFEHRWLFLYLTINLFLTALTTILSELGTNNMIIYHIIGLSELILLFLYYKQEGLGTWLVVLFWFIFFFYVSQSIFFVSTDEINSLARSCTTLYLILLGMCYLYRVYRRPENIVLEKSFMFWVNSALIIYLSGSFFAFLFSYEFLIRMAIDDFSSVLKYGWTCYAAGNLMKSIIISIGLIKCK